MDELFFREKHVTKNLPILLALIDHKRDRIQKFKTKIICPYNKGLS